MVLFCLTGHNEKSPLGFQLWLRYNRVNTIPTLRAIAALAEHYSIPQQGLSWGSEHQCSWDIHTFFFQWRQRQQVLSAVNMFATSLAQVTDKKKVKNYSYKLLFDGSNYWNVIDHLYITFCPKLFLTLHKRSKLDWADPSVSPSSADTHTLCAVTSNCCGAFWVILPGRGFPFGQRKVGGGEGNGALASTG